MISLITKLLCLIETNIHFVQAREHSFMPPNRVFRRREQFLRKKENIISPNQYFDIFKKFCTKMIMVKMYHCYDEMLPKRTISIEL